jgi:hypothetical protein
MSARSKFIGYKLRDKLNCEDYSDIIMNYNSLLASINTIVGIKYIIKNQYNKQMFIRLNQYNYVEFDLLVIGRQKYKLYDVHSFTQEELSDVSLYFSENIQNNIIQNTPIIQASSEICVVCYDKNEDITTKCNQCNKCTCIECRVELVIRSRIHNNNIYVVCPFCRFRGCLIFS